MTWRSTDELLELVRRATDRQGHSMNEFVTAVLDAATNPELAGSDADRGLLRPSRNRCYRADSPAGPATAPTKGSGRKHSLR
jgi:hypothetical protein